MEKQESKVLPFVGHTYEVNFGQVILNNTFESDQRMTYTPVKGGLGVMQTVNYKSIEIQPNAYFQFWQEAGKTTVTRYVDFEKLVVYATITLPDHTFLTPQGTLKRLD